MFSEVRFSIPTLDLRIPAIESLVLVLGTRVIAGSPIIELSSRRDGLNQTEQTII